MTAPQVSLTFSGWCERVVGQGWRCMIDDEADAVGHVQVTGGEHDGRYLAVVCARHASADGYREVKARLVDWMMAGLLAADLGPGVAGAAEVLHREPGGRWHRDPIPEHRHDGGAGDPE